MHSSAVPGSLDLARSGLSIFTQVKLEVRAKKNSSVRSILLFYISVSVTGWRAGGW